MASPIPQGPTGYKLSLQTVAICTFPSMAGVLFGYDSGWIAGVLAMDAFKLDFGNPNSTEKDAYRGYLYTSTAKALTTSILSAGTFCGALAAGYVSDRIGRRSTIILGCIIYTIGVVLEVITHGSIDLLAVGRTIAGLGVGFVSATTIMYVSEITPKEIRGSIMGAYQLAITIGLLLAAVVNIGAKHLLNTGAYRIPIGIQFAWALVLGIGMSFMPESPRWYVMKKKGENAALALAQIHGRDPDSELIDDEYKLIADSYEEELAAGAADSSFVDCFKGGLKRGSNLHRTMIGTSIQMFQQLTGVNFIFYYGTTFFQRAGISNPFVVSIITAAVNVVSTPIALWGIERLGRRKLLIFGAIGMAICEFIVAIVGTALPNSTTAQDVLITFVSLFIFCFASTWGPCAWTVCGEIYPQRTRSQSTALSTASNWFWNFIISFVTPYLVDEDKANLGPKIFFIFGAAAVGCGVWAYFVVYETSKLSLEQVDRMMNETSARRSTGWEGRDGFARKRRVDSDVEGGEKGGVRRWWSKKGRREEGGGRRELEQIGTSSSETHQPS
ncbi:related to monosaccharide transporter [Phialocephala subalpina]|uniref:Related to monosaccharide transporter n=1 Tax=Phialocephala subalpina TaxID=576137 RepID=A0A1L7WDT9_9HELO|nr:related to monosaccharide transporter [Phialocephala subalpina]